MSNELQVIDETVIAIEVKAEINEDIDRIIAAHKNNRQAINKLVFESVAAMTEADDAQAELSNKGWLKRRIGSITGSNSRLQDRINSNRATAMYASQQTLQKLAEQNLMTFDLIAAVNNKLNASLIKVDEEFANLYAGLAKFFKASRSELARIETRLEKVERNVNLLNWSRSIEYQEFEGIEYADLDDVSKIVCLVRDFYDITKGEWSNSDLLLLKSTMKEIDISPKDNVNYFEVLKAISRNENLKAYMLDGRTIEPIEDPSCLLSLGCLKKYETLNDEESYMVDTVVEQMNSMGVNVNRNAVCDQMTAKYLATKAYVDVNVDVECYDLILDLLYNIRQAKDENLLIGEVVHEVNVEELFDLGLAFLNGDGVEQSDTQAYDYFQQAANLGDSDAIGAVGRCYEEGIGVKQDFSKAMEWYLKSADLGNAISMNGIGDLYYFGCGVVQDYTKAMEWYLKAADYDNEDAINNLGVLYADGLGVERDYIEAFKWWKKAADLDDARAMNNIGDLYAKGLGVEQDYDEAINWFKKAADLGDEDAINNLEIIRKKIKEQNTYGPIKPIVNQIILNDGNRDIYPGTEKVFENTKLIFSKQLHPNGSVIFRNCEIVFDWNGKTALYAEEGNSEVLFENCVFKIKSKTKLSMIDICGKCTFRNCLFSSLDYVSGEQQLDYGSSVYNHTAFISPSGYADVLLDHCHIENCSGTFIAAFSTDCHVVVQNCLIDNHKDNFIQSWGTYKYSACDVANSSVEVSNCIFNNGKASADAVVKRIIALPNVLPYASLMEAKKYRRVIYTNCTFNNIEQDIFDFKECEDCAPVITESCFNGCKELDVKFGVFNNCEFNDVRKDDNAYHADHTRGCVEVKESMSDKIIDTILDWL